MNGHESLLVTILKSAEKLIIPVYQRNYDWKEEHCKTLYDDLCKTIKSNRKTHFFGGIVSVNDPTGAFASHLIIDGQQRITTVTLLLLALANLLKEGKIISDDPYLAETIVKKFLADEINPNKRKVKLKPIKGDADAFDRLWQNPEEYSRSSNVTLNYLYFYNRIPKGELSPSQLFDAVQRLQVINISLTPPDDDPQLVFESLNSTGLDLNEGDKIRNYILMGLPVDVQEKYYNDYWSPIEKKAGYDKSNNSYNVSWFIRDFLSIQQRKIPSINAVYASFKEYAEPFRDTGLEPLLQDMLGYARRYEKLLNGFHGFPAPLNASIHRLNRLESNVTRPFLLEVLRLEEQGVISSGDTAEVLRVVEAYLFRRIICDLPSNALNKVFLTLANDVRRLDGTWDSFVDKMKYILVSKKEKARFPDDAEFAEGLLEKNIYMMPPRYKAYLFERFENGDSLEYKSVYDRLDTGDYSIEHIMPQRLTAEWQESLGPDYETIHTTWLHRLANLTLSAYNSTYSNRPFEEKRTMEHGFIDSGLRMNQYIAGKTQWGLTELEERAAHLIDKAARLWSYAQTEYAPPEKQLDEYALDDDITFTNKAIVKYRFNGVENEVRSWADMYISVLRTLHEKNKAVLNYLADADSSVDLSLHIVHAEAGYTDASQIDEDVYVWVNTSTQYKVNLLLKFFALFGEEPENLVFIVKENSSVSNETEGRFAIRRSFWEQAIPAIQSATGIFMNVSPNKNNWIQGATGCSGISYNCVANFSNARVEFYIANANKKANKKLFDMMERQREAIDDEYGVALIWERLDDHIASKVYCQLDGVGIGNEGDWPRMIDFLGSQAAKLKDVFQHRLETAFPVAFQNKQGDVG